MIKGGWVVGKGKQCPGSTALWRNACMLVFAHHVGLARFFIQRMNLVAGKSAEYATELWCQLPMTQATYKSWNTLQQSGSHPCQGAGCSPVL